MAWIRLANWLRGARPGDVVEVPDDEVKPLTRDGRVAEVLPGPPGGGGHGLERYAGGGTLPPGRSEAVNDTAEPEPVIAPKRGRRRAEE